ASGGKDMSRDAGRPVEPLLSPGPVIPDAWEEVRTRGSVLFSEAERELRWIHRLEQAQLLRAAARLAGHRRRRPGPPPRPAAPTADPPRALSRWRARALEELRWALRDGCPPPRLLERCLVLDPRAWPDALELSRAALELHDGFESRLQLARCLLALARTG